MDGTYTHTLTHVHFVLKILLYWLDLSSDTAITGPYLEKIPCFHFSYFVVLKLVHIVL